MISTEKKQIPDLPPEPSDTSDFPAPEGYPSWVVIQQDIEQSKQFSKENM